MKHSHDVYSAFTYAADLTKQIIEAQNQIIRNEGRMFVMKPDWMFHDSVTAGDLYEPLPGDIGTRPCDFDENGKFQPKDIIHNVLVELSLDDLTRALSAERFTPKRILRCGIATIVFWEDGTKTVVERAPDEPDNEYAAFTAALARKIYGSNSAIKRILKQKTECHKSETEDLHGGAK